MFQLETEAEQDAFFQNARLDLRMANGAKVHRLELAHLVHRAVGQGLAGFEVAIAAEIVGMPVEFEPELFGCGFCHLEGFGSDFRPRAIATDDCNIVSFHLLLSLQSKQGRSS